MPVWSILDGLDAFARLIECYFGSSKLFTPGGRAFASCEPCPLQILAFLMCAHLLGVGTTSLTRRVFDRIEKEIISIVNTKAEMIALSSSRFNEEQEILESLRKIRIYSVV